MILLDIETSVRDHSIYIPFESVFAPHLYPLHPLLISASRSRARAIFEISVYFIRSPCSISSAFIQQFLPFLSSRWFLISDLPAVRGWEKADLLEIDWSFFWALEKKKKYFSKRDGKGKKKKRQDGSSGSGLGSARSHRVELNRVEPVFHAACSTSDTIEYTTDQALFTFLFSIRRCHWYYGGGVIAKYISISTVTHLPTQLH